MDVKKEIIKALKEKFEYRKKLRSNCKELGKDKMVYFYHARCVQILEDIELIENIYEAAVNEASKCDCGNPVDARFDPCCSLTCWGEKFD